MVCKEDFLFFGNVRSSITFSKFIQVSDCGGWYGWVGSLCAKVGLFARFPLLKFAD